MTRITTGNRNPRNLSIDSKGSIHDDATATDLGFRAGTVAGDIHLEQFGQILVDGFGKQWFENGWLSMYFQQATADREPVEAWLEGDGDLRTAGINTPEGAVVAEGNAGIGAAGPSALYARDRRSVDPSQLRMLRDVRIGQALDIKVRSPWATNQHARINANTMSAPMDWYGTSSPWGGGISSPLTTCQLMVAGVTDSIAASCGDFVGLYGAIEIRNLAGPLMLDHEYVISGEVIDVSETPKTEVLWYRTQARPSIDPEGPVVAELTMMTRLLKGSSPRYS